MATRREKLLCFLDTRPNSTATQVEIIEHMCKVCRRPAVIPLLAQMWIDGVIDLIPSAEQNTWRIT